MELSINTEISDRSKKEFLSDLKRLIRLGKIASRVYDTLEKSGGYNGLVPVASPPIKTYNKKIGGYAIRKVELKQVKPLSSSDLPDLKSYKFELLKGYSDKDRTITMTGPVFVVSSDYSSGQHSLQKHFTVDSLPLGKLIRRSKDFAIIPIINYRSEPRKKLFRDNTKSNALPTLWSLAKCMASVICRNGNDTVSKQMMKKIESELIENRMVHKYADSLLALAEIDAVMES